MTRVADRLGHGTLQRQVLEIVSDLAAERHDLERPIVVSADTSLEGDLGLFSLERVELGLRLEAATGLVFDAGALGEARTVGDLILLTAGESLVRGEVALTAGIPSVPASAGPGRSLPFTIRVAILLATVGIGLRLRLLARPGAAASRRALRWGARALLRAAAAVPTVHGLHHLQQQLPAVLVVNHQSYVDTAVLLAALPVDALLIPNERLRQAPLLGAAIAAAGYLIVDRTTTPGRVEGASRMAEALRQGHTLLVFPEGTIEVGPRLGRFRLGAFAAAVQTGRPVIPVTLRGTREVLPLTRWTLARGPLSVTIHPPIPPAGTGWSETVRTARLARMAIENALAAADSGALGVHRGGEPHQRA